MNADGRRAAAAAGLALAAAGALFAAPALARERPNPAGRVVLDPAAPLPVGRDQSAKAAAAAPAPLPAGAELIGSTWYDLQDMGSLGTRLVRTPDGAVQVVFQDDFCELDAQAGCPPNLALPNPFAQRAMAHVVRAPGGAWGPVRKVQDARIRGCCVSEAFGGHGTLDVTAGGRAAVAQHMNEDGCDLRGDMYLQEAAGGATYAAYLGAITPDSYLFPQVAANANGSFTLYGEVPAAGIYDEVEDFRLAWLAAEGQPFTCPVGWQFSAWKSVATAAPPALFRDGRPAFPALARASDGRVGVAFGDFGGNVFLLESSDGTFNSATLALTTITSYVDAAITAPDAASTQFRPYINCDLSYDGTTPHVVWSELQARRVGGVIRYFDHRSRIRHWSPGTGTTTVHQVQPGEADLYDDIDSGGSGPLAGFNHISVDWPQVGFNDAGTEVVVAWLRFVDAEIDATADAGLPGIITGIGFGDIVASVAAAGGGAWSPPQNLTQTPTTDERYFALAERNADGRAHLVFQASATDQAGIAAIGDRGTNPGLLLRNIAYLERDLAGSTSAVGVEAGLPALDVAASPNPSGGDVRFALRGPAADGPARLRVYSLRGDLVAEWTQDGGTATWDARDRQGRPVPAGVYFARVQTRAGAATHRFVIVR